MPPGAKKGPRATLDTRALWLRDAEDGFVTHVHVTSANKAEVKELEPILEIAPIWGRLYADKGYASCANKQLLKESKIKNGI